jgi:hypothetical protein
MATLTKQSHFVSQREKMERYAVSSEIRENIRAMELKPHAIKEITEMAE